MKKYLFLLALLFSIGCASNGVKEVSHPSESLIPTGVHEFTSRQYVQYTSCDYQSWYVEKDGKNYDADPEYRKEWASSMHAQSRDNIDTAVNSLSYALMSYNVYRDQEDVSIFVIPDWEMVHSFESNSDLQFEHWHRTDNGKLLEVAIVFRGTESAKDWMANLSFWKEPKQYAEAQSHFREHVINNSKYVGVPIKVAGHSLGGAIALNVALRQSTKNRPIEVYGFNPSPRFFYGQLQGKSHAVPYILVESGEFLKEISKLWEENIGNIDTLKIREYQFLQFTTIGKIVSEHSMYRMARALLLLSIGANDDYAKKVFKQNFKLDDIAPQLPSYSYDSVKQEWWALDKHGDLDYCRTLLSKPPFKEQLGHASSL